MDQDPCSTSFDTLDDEVRLEGLVEDAAGVVAASRGKVKIKAAMGLVGFDEDEVQSKTLYQAVRRKVTKVTVSVEKAYGKRSMPVVDLVGGNSLSTLSSLTAGVNSFELSSPSATSITGSNSDSDKKPAAKKARRSSKEVQRDNAKKSQLTKRDKQAMKVATVLVDRTSKLPMNHPEKKSIASIVEETNIRMHSNISKTTVARYVREGLIGVSPMKRGPVGDFPPIIYNSLKGAFVTYLKLEQAGGKKQSTMVTLAKLVNGCVNKGGYNKATR
jgi:hypothetical protein